MAVTSLEVFPNPAHQFVTLVTLVARGQRATATGATVEFLDATGRVVRVEQLAADATTVDVRTLRPGLYTLRYNGCVQRLVVE